MQLHFTFFDSIFDWVIFNVIWLVFQGGRTLIQLFKAHYKNFVSRCNLTLSVPSVA